MEYSSGAFKSVRIEGNKVYKEALTEEQFYEDCDGNTSSDYFDNDENLLELEREYYALKQGRHKGIYGKIFLEESSPHLIVMERANMEKYLSNSARAKVIEKKLLKDLMVFLNKKTPLSVGKESSFGMVKYLSILVDRKKVTYSRASYFLNHLYLNDFYSDILDDMHSENWGYIKGRPVIIDAGQCNRKDINCTGFDKIREKKKEARTIPAPSTINDYLNKNPEMAEAVNFYLNLKYSKKYVKFLVSNLREEVKEVKVAKIILPVFFNNPSVILSAADGKQYQVELLETVCVEDGVVVPRKR